jgi:hypothetical protein
MWHRLPSLDFSRAVWRQAWSRDLGMPGRLAWHAVSAVWPGSAGPVGRG